MFQKISNRHREVQSSLFEFHNALSLHNKIRVLFTKLFTNLTKWKFIVKTSTHSRNSWQERNSSFFRIINKNILDQTISNNVITGVMCGLSAMQESIAGFAATKETKKWFSCVRSSDFALILFRVVNIHISI